ncbi:MAG: hypothetical protein F6K11_22500 [Leptolyngbya sp. SIO3F4]|nr:hypothetical protein [Leptolyngbya sp. SIO3F4]
MINFLINGVLASILGSFLLLILGGFFSHYARWLLTGLFGRILDIDIEYVFRSKSEADKEIEKEISKASFIYVMLGRGYDFQRELFIKSSYQNRPRKLTDFKVLLPDPYSDETESNWIEQREKELANAVPAFGKGLLRQQIKTTISFLESYVKQNYIELRLFNFPHLGFLLITDRVAYFSPYSTHQENWKCRVIQHRRGGDFYEFFVRLFFQVWEVSLSCTQSEAFNKDISA